MTRERINEENKWRLEKFREIYLNRVEIPEIWASISEKWIQRWQNEFSDSLIFNSNPFPIGPELIWMGEKYHSNIEILNIKPNINEIGFIGYNPRYSETHEMGYRYSLCQYYRKYYNKNYDPTDFSQPMNEICDNQYWDVFSKGESFFGYDFSGYSKFLHISSPYSFSSIINLFFQNDYENDIVLNWSSRQLKNYVYRKTSSEEIDLRIKRNILNYIAISNAYIFPGPRVNQNPDQKLRNFQIQNGIFKRTLNAIQPKYLFVFKDEYVWNEDRLWQNTNFVDVGNIKPGDYESYGYLRRYKLKNHQDCRCILIPHLSWKRSKAMIKYLSESFRSFIEAGWNL